MTLNLLLTGRAKFVIENPPPLFWLWNRRHKLGDLRIVDCGKHVHCEGLSTILRSASLSQDRLHSVLISKKTWNYSLITFRQPGMWNRSSTRQSRVVGSCPLVLVDIGHYHGFVCSNHDLVAL